MPMRVVRGLDVVGRVAVLLALGAGAYWAFLDTDLPLTMMYGKAKVADVPRGESLVVEWRFIQRRTSCTVHIHRAILSQEPIKPGEMHYQRILPEQVVTLDPPVSPIALPYTWPPISWGPIPIPEDMPLGLAFDKLTMYAACNPIQQVLPESLQILMEPPVVPFNVVEQGKRPTSANREDFPPIIPDDDLR